MHILDFRNLLLITCDFIRQPIINISNEIIEFSLYHKKDNLTTGKKQSEITSEIYRLSGSFLCSSSDFCL